MKRFLIFCLALACWFSMPIKSVGAEIYKVGDDELSDLAVCQILELKFFALVNEYRKDLGLTRVNYDYEVANICKQHASNLTRFELNLLIADDYLRSKIAHENYYSRFVSFTQIVKNNGYSISRGGEIVSFGVSLVFDGDKVLIEETVRTLLEEFLASPGHRAIIETPCNPGAYFGAGAVLVEDRIIFVANFVDIN